MALHIKEEFPAQCGRTAGGEGKSRRRSAEYLISSALFALKSGIIVIILSTKTTF